MRPGDRIRLTDGSSDEIGRLEFIYTGHKICDANFPSQKYRKVDIALFISIDEEERERQRQMELRKLENERREHERQRQIELRKLENERRETELERSKLWEQFKSGFIAADAYYAANTWTRTSARTYQAEKHRFVQEWIEYATGRKVDLDQAAAVGCVNGNVRVTARAGSGKTTTLVSRALFLNSHCGIPQSQLLLLAFNKKAAEEMSERLEHSSGRSFTHVMTFHALAYAIVHPEESLLHDGGGGEGQGLSRSIQMIIDDYLQKPKFRADVQKLMLAHFREDWDRITEGGFDKSKEDFLKLRRSLQRESLRGEYVKSFGEKLIANFLFEHGIPYNYERNHWWSGINYRPDFTIPTGDNSGIIIEYFGLLGDPDYDELAKDKRLYWQEKSGWQLLELYPQDIATDNSRLLQEKIREAVLAANLECRQLSEDEIWSQIRHRAIDRFTRACAGFVGRCRKRQLPPNELADMVREFPCESEVEEQFLHLASFLYSAYIRMLESTGEEDFDGLLQRAIDLVLAGNTSFERKSGQGDLTSLRYIFIDEYQDFSQLFFALIEAIRQRNHDVQFFCVGDDWQAINSFAGGDLRFFHCFGAYFSQFTDLSIRKNYRSARSIVSAGNAVMKDRGEPAEAATTDIGKVHIARLKVFLPTALEQEQHRGDSITPATLRVASKAIRDGKNVVMLSRRNALPHFVNYQDSEITVSATAELDKFLEHVRSYFPKDDRNRIQISSTHKFKGREADVVIVLDAVSRSYPLIHPDWIFLRIFGDSVESITDEERRLFYVALTRAARELVIFTEQGDESPFLDALMQSDAVSDLDWGHFPSHVSVSGAHIIVKVGNQPKRGTNPTFAIKNELKSQGYRWSSAGWQGWAKSFSSEKFSVEMLQKQLWSHNADGIEVQVLDERDIVIERYFIDGGIWKSA